MSLVTRCPRCKTLFRVMPAQLQARAGQVRCGRCMHVFDGFQALAVEQANANSDPVRFEPDAAATGGGAPVTETAAATASVAAEAAPPDAAAPATPATSAAPESKPDAKPETAAEPAAPPRRRFREFADTRIAGPLREELLRRPTPHARQIALCVLLSLVLAVQAAYAFRSQLAARYPVLRAALTSVCGLAGCSVLLPQRPDLVKIEASDVHMIDAARPALIQLTATLRSYASHDLAYPALDLVLTNANEHALARRIFVPEEYLDETRDPKAGVPPRAEITVALDLDTGDLNAAGFRLDLIAAPAPQASN